MSDIKTYLLDTNILIHLLRGKDTGCRIDAEFAIRKNLHRSLVSIITVGELYAFASRRKWGKKSLDDLERLITDLVVVDITHPEVTKAYGEVDSGCKGHEIGQNDRWIAATCRATKAILLTCDRDFEHLIQKKLIDGISVLSKGAA